VQADIEDSRKQLDLKEVDYEATMAAKLSIAKRVYRLEKDQIFSSAAFKRYFEENKVNLFLDVLICRLKCTNPTLVFWIDLPEVQFLIKLVSLAELAAPLRRILLSSRPFRHC